MSYHEELLSLALDLTDSQKNATQAELRRAVSTAYYALFHLLVAEAALNWSRDSSRSALARMFDHGLMKRLSDKTADPKAMPFRGEDAGVVARLRAVAEAFVRLQDNRHIADYDNGKTWNRSQALYEVYTAADAFMDWKAIRHTDIAQEYLVSLLIRPRG